MDAAEGLVRCGQCQQIFNAQQNLASETKFTNSKPKHDLDNLSKPALPAVTKPTTPAIEEPKIDTDLDPSIPIDKLRQTRFDHFDLGNYDRKSDVSETALPDHTQSDIEITEQELTDALNILSDQPSAGLSIPESTVIEAINTPSPEFDEISIFDDIPEHGDNQDKSDLNFSAVSEEAVIVDDWDSFHTTEPSLNLFDDAESTDHTHISDAVEQNLSESKHNYAYTNIDDDLKEEENIDDMFSEMHQQLSEPAEDTASEYIDDELIEDEIPEHIPPTVDKSTLKDKDEDELNQAIDSIFFDSSVDFGNVLPTEEDAYRVEKEVLASLNKSAEYSQHISPVTYDDEIIIGQHATESKSDHIGSHSSANDDIPLRLRDSLKAHPPLKTSLGKKILSAFALLLLTTLLLGQAALFRNTDIISVLPAAQPWLEIYCSYLPCRIHTQRDIKKIRILERDIRAHNTQKNALLITATIVNKANYKQPYPDIQVMLSDLTGATVAQRRFTPADYMGELNNPFLLMKSGTPVHISIGVVDPGNDAVNFEFSFL